MFLWLQLILLVLVGGSFALLLRTFRKQNAMEESFLCSILLMAAGCVMPDSLLLFPAVWWAFTVLWSDCLRVYLASLCGILLVLFYAALAWYVLPDSWLVCFVQGQFTDAFSRTFCWSPIYTSANAYIYTATTAVVAILGLWSIIAHFMRFTRANVRVQTYLLVALPYFGLSLLSCIFPTRMGNSMLSVLVGITLFLIILYLHAYGFPRIRRAKRRKNPSRRKWKGRKNPYR